LRPKTASMVTNLHKYKWNDQAWMAKKKDFTTEMDRPISVYEVHLGSWRRVPKQDNRWLTYRELADWLLPHVKNLGFHPHRADAHLRASV
jgi:1,4-alpha-glucan branching enzyme